mmetsp:Transcript_12145/g.33412  ORF Transcript_12145/g.33412 Transcript_12145/m.33412 type:complete len:376 (-) Transcript_12145:182-1309(-)
MKPTFSRVLTRSSVMVDCLHSFLSLYWYRWRLTQRARAGFSSKVCGTQQWPRSFLKARSSSNFSAHCSDWYGRKRRWSSSAVVAISASPTAAFLPAGEAPLLVRCFLDERLGEAEETVRLLDGRAAAAATMPWGMAMASAAPALTFMFMAAACAAAAAAACWRAAKPCAWWNMSSSMSWLRTLRVSSRTARLDWWFWRCIMSRELWMTFILRGSSGSGSSSLCSKRSLPKASSNMSGGSSERTCEVMSTDLASCCCGVSMAVCGSGIIMGRAAAEGGRAAWSTPKRDAAMPSKESLPTAGAPAMPVHSRPFLVAAAPAAARAAASSSAGVEGRSEFATRGTGPVGDSAFIATSAPAARSLAWCIMASKEALGFML